MAAAYGGNVFANLRSETSGAIADTLKYLNELGDPAQRRAAINFLDWYDSLEPATFTDRQYSAWVVRGAPLVTGVIDALDRVIANLQDRRLQSFLGGSSSSLIASLGQTIDDVYDKELLFLGCAGDLRNWYHRLLPYVTNAEVRQSIAAALDDRCLHVRNNRLRA